MMPGAPRVRPTAVTVAGWLLFLVAGLQVLGLIVALTQVGTISDVYEEAYRGTSAEDAAKVGAVASTLGTAGVGVLFAIAFVLLAIFNNRGKNPSRITTWVVGGLGVCCSGLGLLTVAVGNSFSVGNGDSDLPDPADVRQRVEDALPSWYAPVTLTATVLVLLSLVLTLILLALPPSNEFFRKREPVWQPPPAYPLSGGGYPPPGAPGGYQPLGGPGGDQSPGAPGGYQPPGGAPGESSGGSPPLSGPPPGSAAPGGPAPDNPSGNPPSGNPPSAG